MLRRLSSRMLRSALFAVVVVNVLVFSTLELVDSLGGASERTPSLGPQATPEAPPQTKFDRRVAAQFARLAQSGRAAWLVSANLTQVDIVLPFTRFLKNKDGRQFESADSWLNSDRIFYDPRFTLSVYLSELARRYAELAAGTDAHGRQIDLLALPPPTLPFSWLDWMDLTGLNAELSKPPEERWTCERLRQHINNRPDMRYFCSDNGQLRPEDVARMGFRRRSQLPGVSITAHLKHDDRSDNDIRVYQALNHAFTQHLEKPARVVILNGDGGTLEFEVDRYVDERIITSDLAHNYLQYHQFDAADFDELTLIRLNHVEVFDSMKERFRFRSVSAAEDPAGMRLALRYSSTRELVLDAGMFSYPDAAVEELISELEERGLSSLQHHELQYYNGMRYCVEFETKNEPEYFKMAVINVDDPRNTDNDWGWHYDWRFFAGALNYKRPGWTPQQLTMRTQIILDRLLRSWQRFCYEKGLVNWIMHGPLLSWYWNGQMFPYDIDIDVQMPVTELLRLARDFNQTLVVEDPSEGYGKFLIDVSPFIHNRQINPKTNYIDARFVDVDSGIYIDITGLSKSRLNPPDEYSGNRNVNIEKPKDSPEAEVYNDRRKHFYTLDQLSPLRYSMLGGTPSFVPSTIVSRLQFEYSSGLTKFEHDGWYFAPILNMWIQQRYAVQLYPDTENKDKKVDKRKLLDKVHAMSEADALKLLSRESSLLVEYYLTKRLSDFHAKEKEFLFDNMGRDNVRLRTDKALKSQYADLVSTIKFGKPLRKALYDFEYLEKPEHDPKPQA